MSLMTNWVSSRYIYSETRIMARSYSYILMCTTFRRFRNLSVVTLPKSTVEQSQHLFLMTSPQSLTSLSNVDDDDNVLTSWTLLSSSSVLQTLHSCRAGHLATATARHVWLRSLTPGPAWCSFPGLRLGPRNAEEDLRTLSHKIWNSISLKVFEY